VGDLLVRVRMPADLGSAVESPSGEGDAFGMDELDRAACEEPSLN